MARGSKVQYLSMIETEGLSNACNGAGMIGPRDYLMPVMLLA